MTESFLQSHHRFFPFTDSDSNSLERFVFFVLSNTATKFIIDSIKSIRLEKKRSPERFFRCFLTGREREEKSGG